MPYKIWNTALDHSRRLAQRQAAKMQMEPVINGRRLRLRESLEISDQVFETNRANLELYKKQGVVDWKKLGAEEPAEVKKEAPAKPAEVAKVEEPVAPAPVEPAKVEEPPAPAVEEKMEEAPLAETPPAPVEPEPQPKSPFKGKKKS